MGPGAWRLISTPRGLDLAKATAPTGTDQETSIRQSLCDNLGHGEYGYWAAITVVLYSPLLQRGQRRPGSCVESCLTCDDQYKRLLFGGGEGGRDAAWSDNRTMDMCSSKKLCAFPELTSPDRGWRQDLAAPSNRGHKDVCSWHVRRQRYAPAAKSLAMPNRRLQCQSPWYETRR